MLSDHMLPPPHSRLRPNPRTHLQTGVLMHRVKNLRKAGLTGLHIWLNYQVR